MSLPSLPTGPSLTPCEKEECLNPGVFLLQKTYRSNLTQKFNNENVYYYLQKDKESRVILKPQKCKNLSISRGLVPLTELWA